jgi:hypothetical protein
VLFVVTGTAGTVGVFVGTVVGDSGAAVAETVAETVGAATVVADAPDSTVAGDPASSGAGIDV